MTSSVINTEKVLMTDDVIVHVGQLVMDLVHYSKGIPCAMHCGYFVLVKMLLCRHYPMLKGLCFSGVSQYLAISQTGHLTRTCSEKDFTAYIQSV